MKYIKYAFFVVLLLISFAFSGNSVEAACYTFSTNLKQGSTGADVVALQTWLIANDFHITLIEQGLQTKGFYGFQTQRAVAAYQRSVNISPADGYFGPITRAKVNATCPQGGVVAKVNSVVAVADVNPDPYITSTGYQMSVGAPIQNGQVTTFPVRFRFTLTNSSDLDINILRILEVPKDLITTGQASTSFNDLIAIAPASLPQDNAPWFLNLAPGTSRVFEVITYMSNPFGAVGTSTLELKSLTAFVTSVGQHVFNFDSGSLVAGVVFPYYPGAPIISSMTPSLGLPGTIITIKGSDFGTSTAFFFNNVYLTPTRVGDDLQSYAIGLMPGIYPVRVKNLVTNLNSNTVYFTILSSTTQSLTVTSPNGGEKFKLGDKMDIRWNTQGISQDAEIYITLSYIKNGQPEQINVHEGAVPNTGSYSWVIPKDQLPTTYTDPNSYKINISVRGLGGDSSDLPFTIDPLPVQNITVTSARSSYTPRSNSNYTGTILFKFTLNNLTDDDIYISKSANPVSAVTLNTTKGPAKTVLNSITASSGSGDTSAAYMIRAGESRIFTISGLVDNTGGLPGEKKLVLDGIKYSPNSSLSPILTINKELENIAGLTLSFDMNGGSTSDKTPPVISDISCIKKTDSFEPQWNTNEPADGTVEYGPTVSYGKSVSLPFMRTNHGIIIPSPANTTWHYRVKSKDPSGNLATSGDYTCTTLVPGAGGAPVIRTQPRSIMATVGSRATFTVVATGTPPLNYQWTEGGNPLVNPNGNSPIYVTPPLTLANNGEIYNVIVSNGISPDAESEFADLQVLAPTINPTFISSDTSVTVGPNQNDDVGLFTIKYRLTAVGDDMYIRPSNSVNYAVDKAGTTINSPAISTVLINNTDPNQTVAGNYLIEEGESETFTFTASVPLGGDLTAGQYRLSINGLKWDTQDDATPSNTLTSGLGDFRTSYVALSFVGNSNQLASVASAFGGIVVGNRIKTTDNLNVRVSPGSNIVGIESRGAEGVVVEGPVKYGASDWVRINYSSGITGWSIADYITKL